MPIGRFGSCSPARERRSAFETASTASSWPMTRSCRRSSMWISFSTSPSIRRETGMPVHLATTSATSSASTSSLQEARLAAELGGRRPRRAAALELGDLAVAQLGGALEVGLALGALELACGPARARSLTSRDRRRSRPSRAAMRPSSRRAAPCSSASSRSIASRRAADASSRLLLERLLLDLELHDAALDLVDLGRHRVDLDAQARGGLVDQVDRLVGQEAVGDVAVATASRRR